MVDDTAATRQADGLDVIAKVVAVYPAQEPLSPLGEAYAARALQMGAGISGRDVSYGDDPQQVLTVFAAQNPNGKVFVVFHGGGWTNGYKEWMSFMAPAFNALGVTLVSATYRLAPKHIFPAGYSDCADAVAWVYRTLKPELGENFCLFVGGHSAGGHYAALLAVAEQWRSERDLPSDLLAGCLPISGTYWFGPTSGLSMRPRFLGPDEVTDEQASPLPQVGTSLTPPFFLSYGSRDFPHLIKQSEVMVEALRTHGVPCDVSIILDADHFDAAFAAGDPGHPWIAEAYEWMLRHCSSS